MAARRVTGLQNSVTRKPNAGAGSYAVTPVTHVPYTHAGAQVGACVCVCRCAPRMRNWCNRVTIACLCGSRGYACAQARNSLFVFLKRKERVMEEQDQAESVAQRRCAMPTVAAFIDMCRKAYGADMVDAQLRTAQEAAREHDQVLATQGAVAAARWHRANAHRCTFSATEGGRNVGLASPFGQLDQAHPPIGTSSAASRAGNSNPKASPVAGLGKSELVGAQRGVK